MQKQTPTHDDRITLLIYKSIIGTITPEEIWNVNTAD